MASNVAGAALSPPAPDRLAAVVPPAKVDAVKAALKRQGLSFDDAIDDDVARTATLELTPEEAIRNNSALTEKQKRTRLDALQREAAEYQQREKDKRRAREKKIHKREQAKVKREKTQREAAAKGKAGEILRSPHTTGAHKLFAAAADAEGPGAPASRKGVTGRIRAPRTKYAAGVISFVDTPPGLKARPASPAPTAGRPASPAPVAAAAAGVAAGAAVGARRKSYSTSAKELDEADEDEVDDTYEEDDDIVEVVGLSEEEQHANKRRKLSHRAVAATQPSFSSRTAQRAASKRDSRDRGDFAAWRSSLGR